MINTVQSYYQIIPEDFDFSVKQNIFLKLINS